MNVTTFIEDFEDCFDEVEKGSIQENTIFKELDEWSSLIALIVIAMVDEKFNYRLSASDFKESVTVKDLFNKIKNE